MSKKVKVTRDAKDGKPFEFALGQIRVDEATLRKIIANSHNATIIISNDMRFEYVSEEGYRIFGGAEEDLLGHQVTEFITPDSAKLVSERYAQRIKGAKVIDSYPITIYHKDKSLRIIDIRISLIKTTDGTQKALIHAQDRTEEKQSQDLLQASEERYRTLVETMNDGLAIDDNDCIVTYANEAFCNMLEYKPKDIIGQCWVEFTKEKDMELFKAKVKERQSGKSDRYELVWVTKSGRVIPTIVSAAPIQNAEGTFTGTFAVITEITIQKDAEDTVQFYLDLLTHDISNQLQVIMTSAGLLDQDLLKSYLDDAQQDIQDAVERCTRLITKVKRAGQLRHLPRTRMDLSTVVKEKIAVLDRVYSTHSILKNLDNPASVWADALLGELVWNLLENAARHNPSEDKKVWVSATRKNGYIQLSIADNGPGISKARKKTIFDKSKRQGGVGLTLVSQMARKYCGTLEVEDRVKGKPNQGAKFVLSLIEAK
ncbi:MAG: PAS domain-containing sensor histidine kinase [Candidatus Thorarchaeota archaeon]|nr:PAS domain-containing sensor histidine kinase [Candidatus Thorarchaeota archaeon]